MSQAHVEQVLGRMLTDDGFRRSASLDLAKACREEGYLLNNWELDLVSRFDTSTLAPAAGILDSGIKRFSGSEERSSP